MRIYPNTTVDYEFDTLGTAGYSGSLNDKQDAYLNSLGFTGALSDKFGSFKSLVPIVGNTAAIAGIDFTTGSVRTYGGLDFGVGFSRASAGTFIDAAGNIQTAGVNTARVQSVGGGRFGLLMEAGRTNRLLNSAVVVTQSFSTTGLQATLSFYGTGSITLSGTATGTLAGTGANNRVSLTFTPTTGTLTITPSGDVRMGQLETGSSATSYIATGGTTVTRSPDLANIALPASVQTAMAAGYWVAVQGAVMGDVTGGFDRVYQFDNGNDQNIQVLFRIDGSGEFGVAQFFGGAAQAVTTKTSAVNQRLNMATKFAVSGMNNIWWDGAQYNSGAIQYLTPTSLRIAAADAAGVGKPASLLIERIDLFPPTISLADMAAYRSAMP